MRDHLLGWPGVLALIEPEAKPDPRGLGQSLPDPFETEDWTHVGAHLYGAAQAPQSESSRANEAGRRDVSSAEHAAATPEAAPPSGQWVLTSERKPPIGMHKTRPAGLTRNSWERYFDGFLWSVEKGSDPCTEQNREWFEPQVATPQPDSDGWIEHTGDDIPPGICELFVDVILRGGKKITNTEAAALRWSRSGTSFGEEWDITHYRLIQQ